MKYSRQKIDDINSQEKLRKFLIMNDRQNRLSFKVIDGMLESNRAKEDIEKAQSGYESEQVIVERQKRAEEQDRVEKQLKREIIQRGLQPISTYTTKKGERKVLFVNYKQQTVASGFTDKRGRNTGRLVVNGKLTGRFASLK
jgi:hypothetical protein